MGDSNLMYIFYSRSNHIGCLKSKQKGKPENMQEQMTSFRKLLVAILCQSTCLFRGLLSHTKSYRNVKIMQKLGDNSESGIMG